MIRTQSSGAITTDPDADSAPPWGALALGLRFAGVRFVLTGLTEDQRAALCRRYSCERLNGDALPSGDHCVETRICRLSHLDQDADNYTTAGFYTPRIKRNAEHIEIEGHGFLAQVQFGPPLKGVLWAADGALLTMPLVIENYLRIIAAYASLLNGGLLLHSAGVVAGGRAYLFLGRSGAGKTTMSRLALASGADILSDDINIVLPAETEGFRVCAVPFAGELGTSRLVRDGDYPLGGVFWLQKGAVSDNGPIGLPAQLARIYACCPVVNADARQMDRILDTGRRMLTAQPMRALHFGLDEAFSAILARIRDMPYAG